MRRKMGIGPDGTLQPLDVLVKPKSAKLTKTLGDIAPEKVLPPKQYEEMSAKELKVEATKLNIEFKKNASAKVMLELLTDYGSDEL